MVAATEAAVRGEAADVMTAAAEKEWEQQLQSQQQ